MKITIYGASDDLIEIEGDIEDEIDCYGRSPKLYIYNENNILEFCIKTSFKSGFWEVYPILDEKSFDCEANNRLSKDWKIDIQMGGYHKHNNNSMILSIDSFGDSFTITKRRKKK